MKGKRFEVLIKPTFSCPYGCMVHPVNAYASKQTIITSVKVEAVFL
jgi:hypothetical protein